MGIIKGTIGGVDISQYLKPPFVVNPGSAGVVGDATLLLDQEAGGLDIRPRMDVKIWVPFNTGAGTGVAARGRKFGGIVGERDTTNRGTTKYWGLQCEDWNTLFDLLQRDMQAVKAITLVADSFAGQIEALVLAFQTNGAGTVATFIDASTHVADLYPTMPGVTLEPGHSLGWYIQQLCNTVKTLDPTIIPRFYMGHATTFGAAETFGNPTLNVYDYAVTPLPAYVYSDTPTGSEKTVYGEFRRTTTATGLRVIQRRQGKWNTTVFTAVDDTSQALYPCPYINHGRPGNTGYWGAPPINIEATSSAQAQAAIDSSVAATANPLDTLEWETEEQVQPYDIIELKWDLEGIPAGTTYRPARLKYTIEGITLKTTLQLNNRRRGILDDGSDEYPQTPVEGDNVGPVGPAEPAIDSEVWNPVTQKVITHASTTASPSPDAVRYEAYVSDGVFTTTFPIDDFSDFVFEVRPGASVDVKVRAYDRSNNQGDWSDTHTYTSIEGPMPDEPLNLNFEIQDPLDPTLPEYYTRDTPGNSTVTLDTSERKDGLRSIKLVHGTANAAHKPSLTHDAFLSPIGIGATQELTGWFKGDVGGEILFVELTIYDSAGNPLYSEDTTRVATTEWQPFRVPHTVFQEDVHHAIFEIFEFSNVAAAKTIWVDALAWEPVGSEIKEGLITKEQVARLNDLSDQVSLIDRARHASGWRNLGLLTNDAFREACIVYQGGEYYVFYTGVYETEQTDVLHDATLEGIVSGTHVADIVPLKYPSVVYDPVTQVWHLWGLKTTGGVVTQHYTSLSPTSGWAYSDDVDDVLLIDMGFQKHPTDGYWYGIGFLNSAGSTLQLLRASVPEGPWTNLGNVFADVGNPPFAFDARPDPNLAFTGGRDYIFFSGRPTAATSLTQDYFPSICEINLSTGRVIGVPVALLDERDPWMVDGEAPETRGISDLMFLRVAGEPDRIFAWANDGEVTTTDDWGWGCLELSKTDIPSDGRKHTDLVRIDFKRGIDLATNIRPVTRADTEWRDNALVITADEGGAHGYLSQQYIDDFTMYADFTVDGPQAANAMVGVILGPTYAAGPAITIDLDGDDIRAVVQASDDTAVVLTSGITTVPGRRYRVMLMRTSGVVTLRVDGVLVDTDTLTQLITDAQVWSMGAYITLTEPEVYPFIGTIHEFWCTGQALPLSDLAVYTPPSFIGARYKTSSGQSIANNTTTIVNFEVPDYDTHETVTTGAAWKFTAPVAGFYRVGGMITFVTTANWAASESADLDLYKNGARVCNLDRNDNVISSNVIKTLSGCTEVYLVAGDYVDLRAYQQSGASLALFAGAENNYVTVSRAG